MNTQYIRRHYYVVFFGWLIVFQLLALYLNPTLADTGKAQPKLDTAKFRVNNIPLIAEIADEPHERHQGLSFRDRLLPDNGMLFVYAQEQDLFFTMRDASIPLSIAFIDKDLTILEILPMTPHTVGPYPSSAPARFALEMNQGWFKRNNIKSGDKLQPG